jgi:hypothetical protein
MVKEYFKQVSSSFETVQCILSSILCPSIYSEIWRHFNDSPLLCPINTTSSSSYVFRLHYPRVLHCRIVPIRENSSWATWQGGVTIFTKLRLFATTATYILYLLYFITKYIVFIVFLWLMIKIRKYLLFLS